MIQINIPSPGYINHDHSWGEEEKVIIDVWILSQTKADSWAGQCVSDISFKLSQLCKCRWLWASQGEPFSLPVLLTPSGALGGTEPTLGLQRYKEQPVESMSSISPEHGQSPQGWRGDPMTCTGLFWVCGFWGKAFTCSRIGAGSSPYSLQDLWMQ